MLKILLLLVLAPGLSSQRAAKTAIPSPTCLAGNAEFNTALPFLGGPNAYQFVNVSNGPPQGYYAVYSAKQGRTNASGTGTDCDKRTNNSVISVFDIDETNTSQVDEGVLIFGTGYGCRKQSDNTCAGAQFGPRVDARNVSNAIRGCMGKRGIISVQIVVPHGHGDHINPEFLHSMRSMGFSIEAIHVHIDDYEITLNMSAPSVPTCNNSEWLNPFTGFDLTPLIQPFGTRGAMAGCNATPQNCFTDASQSPLLFQSSAGLIWFREREGHTKGSVDLIIDVIDSNPLERFILLGSNNPGRPNEDQEGCVPFQACAQLPGVVQRFELHGNVMFR